MSDAWAAKTGLSAILITVPELADFTDRWRSVSHSTARPHVPLTELIPPHVTVRALLLAVFEAFPECPPYGGEFPDPHPHLTISSAAQGGPDVVAEATEALAAAPAPTARLTEVGLWREGDDSVWRQFGAVPL
ncbi:2'-5' RNA ligase family protein [Kribbella sp. NPDC050470]|uniref:2'-5' RNA ligase family protein n=1 Tax=unclassified Kribbella TaxID=2644121 RepID=UPI0037B264E9